jgi:hypothetical protein
VPADHARESDGSARSRVPDAHACLGSAVLERLVIGRGLGEPVDVFIGECNGGGGLELPYQRVLDTFSVPLVRAEPAQVPARPHWAHR